MMAGESIGCASRKKSKSKNNDKLGKNENNGDLSKTTQRRYKIVILGDGGVGKSGNHLILFFYSYNNLHLSTSDMNMIYARNS